MKAWLWLALKYAATVLGMYVLLAAFFIGTLLWLVYCC